MKITKKQLELDKDREDIFRFLTDIYDDTHTTWSPMRFDYMIVHPNLDHENLNLNTLYYLDGVLSGFLTYEDQKGAVYLLAKTSQVELKKVMVEDAKSSLYRVKDDGKNRLLIYCNEVETELSEYLKNDGFQPYNEDLMYFQSSLFQMNQLLPIHLPKEYSVHSLEVENDIEKINSVLWYGFDHDGEPLEEDIPGRIQVQKASHFDHSLHFVVENPQKEYVAYAGIWVDTVNEVAYIEPVATVPTERKKGLGKAAVYSCMNEVYKRGIRKIFVGSGQPFYLNIGFQVLHATLPYIKEW